MGTSRYFTGTATDGTRYDFVEDTPTVCLAKLKDQSEKSHSAPTYRLSRDGSYLEKTSAIDFTIVRSGLQIRVL
ncbi:MAG: hypothetical protein ABI645_03355 [Pseudomonadota bacterium]